jgi:hypothetical protein
MSPEQKKRNLRLALILVLRRIALFIGFMVKSALLSA